MDKVREIIVDCQEATSKTSDTYYYVNVGENIEKQLKLFTILENNLDILEKQVEIYIENNSMNPTEKFLREWLQCGIDKLTYYFDSALSCKEYKSMLPPDFVEQWPLFFEESYNRYEISFEKTKESIDSILNNSKINNCKDEDILAIHKDKDCDCPYMCGLCDTMERAWYKKIKTKYTQPDNIFMNPLLQSEFIDKWLLENPHIIFKFPPTKLYDIDIAYRDRTKDRYITDYVEACKKIIKDRESYKQQGKTPKECYKDFNHTISYHFSRIKKSDSDFKIFRFLWNKLDVFPVLIAADRERCLEIKDML